MRTRGRVDANQAEIVDVLRRAGRSVTVTSALGRGFPDIVAGHHGHTYLLEVKDPRQPPSKQRLTEDETKWHMEWRGHVAIVRTAEEALAATGGERKMQ